jgi:hypothetical protein
MNILVNKKNILYILVCSLMLPRIAIIYPIYALSAFLLAVDFNGFKEYFVKSLTFFILTLSALMCVSIFYGVSFTGYVLEYVLFLPFFALCMGSSKNWRVGKNWIIKLNYMVLFASLINLIFNFRFPFQLPYIHYLPDAIAAFWGLGGAKIVTVVGFFGLLKVFFDYQAGDRVSRYFLVISMINFISPNYNIGIVAGLFGVLLAVILTLDGRKSLAFIVGILIAALLVAPYLFERVESLNLLFFHEFGMHPKIYSFYSLYELFCESPSLMLTGAGLGNFSGSSAIWASEYLSLTSTHSKISLPGLVESELHGKFLAPALSIVIEDPWSISSSFNKPFSTVSTLLAELGAGGVFLLFFLTKSLKTLILDRFIFFIIVGFFIVIFFVDNLHSNPLFIASVCIGLRGFIK